MKQKVVEKKTNKSVNKSFTVVLRHEQVFQVD